MRAVVPEISPSHRQRRPSPSRRANCPPATVFPDRVVEILLPVQKELSFRSVVPREQEAAGVFPEETIPAFPPYEDLWSAAASGRRRT